MNKLLSNMNLSVVKFLVVIPVILGSGFSASAQTPPVTPAPSDDANPCSAANQAASEETKRQCLKTQELKNQQMEENIANAKKDREEKECKDLEKEASKAKGEVEKACNDAAVGSVKDCFSKAKECQETVRDGEDVDFWKSMGSVAQSLGLSGAADATSSLSTSTCPQYTNDQYVKRRKEINDEIKEINNDINDLKKENNELEKTTQKDIKDAQDDVNEAQKEKQRAEHKIDEELRDQVAAVNKSQGEAKNGLRTNDMNLVKLRGQLLASESKKATQLIQMNENAAKAMCTAEYEKQLNAFQAARAGKSATFTDLKRQKNTLLNAYNTCIKMYDQQRANIIQQIGQEQAEIKKQIETVVGDMEQTEDTIKLAQTQLGDAQTQSKTKKNQEATNLMTKMQSAQTSMQNANSSMQKQQKVFQEKFDNLQKRLKEKNAELAKMGAEPSGDATSTPRKAAGIMTEKMGDLILYKDKCCTGKSGGLCDKAKSYQEYQKDSAQ